MTAATRQSLSVDTLREQVTKVHPTEFPAEVKAVEYEPIAGLDKVTPCLLFAHFRSEPDAAGAPRQLP